MIVTRRRISLAAGGGGDVRARREDILPVVIRLHSQTRVMSLLYTELIFGPPTTVVTKEIFTEIH